MSAGLGIDNSLLLKGRSPLFGGVGFGRCITALPKGQPVIPVRLDAIH